MDSNLIREMTRALASEDFDAFAFGLRTFDREMVDLLAAAPNDDAREEILNEVSSLNRRWLSLAISLRAHMGDQLTALNAESSYLAAVEQSPIINTLG
jgi:hypothetical protein